MHRAWLALIDERLESVLENRVSSERTFCTAHPNSLLALLGRLKGPNYFARGLRVCFFAELQTSQLRN